MDRIRVEGGRPLVGSVEIAGAKNAALPLMAACILTDQPLTLSNVPYLADITTMANLLTHLGVALTVESSDQDSTHHGRVMTLDASGVNETLAPYDIVRRMRASVVVLGPLLARFGEAKVSLPGGCAIGTRPIDYHLRAFEQMGAEILLEEGYVIARAPKGLKGVEITFPQVSVGATENAMMAAVLAEGTTVLHHAAREPEIVDLAHCLNAMGAKISGQGTHMLEIEGVTSLQPARHRVLPDRIEAGSYAIAAAITGGDVLLEHVVAEDMRATLDALQQAEVQVIQERNHLRVRRDPHCPIRPVTITTAPYPGFATDMQAQWMALMTLAHGTSTISETIFENRFMHVPELRRMGAQIKVHGNLATIEGVKELNAAEVMATDLRASISLVLAALATPGETLISRVYHIDRGYERVEEKLSACGASITRIV